MFRTDYCTHSEIKNMSVSTPQGEIVLLIKQLFRNEEYLEVRRKDDAQHSRCTSYEIVNNDYFKCKEAIPFSISSGL